MERNGKKDKKFKIPQIWDDLGWKWLELNEDLLGRQVQPAILGSEICHECCVFGLRFQTFGHDNNTVSEIFPLIPFWILLDNDRFFFDT